MAFKPEDLTRGVAGNANYTYGSCVDGDITTGTKQSASWYNDVCGFLQKLLNEASIVPSGIPDTVLISDYWDALIDAIDTRIAAQPEFASGGIVSMVFYQAVAPLGWTQDESNNDKALRVVSGEGRGSGGSRLFSSVNTGSHTLQVSEIPAHGHNVQGKNRTGTASPPGAPDVIVEQGSLDATLEITDIQNTGGGGGHDHPLNFAYVDVIICTKN